MSKITVKLAALLAGGVMIATAPAFAQVSGGIDADVSIGGGGVEADADIGIGVGGVDADGTASIGIGGRDGVDANADVDVGLGGSGSVDADADINVGQGTAEIDADADVNLGTGGGTGSAGADIRLGSGAAASNLGVSVDVEDERDASLGAGRAGSLAAPGSGRIGAVGDRAGSPAARGALASLSPGQLEEYRRVCEDIVGNPSAYDAALVDLCAIVQSTR